MTQELHDYIRDGAAIYADSFATIRREANLAAIPQDMENCVVRLIHACGMVDLVDDIAFSAGAAQAAKTALRGGKPILCDAEMVARGITPARLPANNPVICTLHEPSVMALAKTLGNTRSAAAVELWREHIEGAVVAIGNAPTALFHLLNRIAAGWPKPAVILGFPVGFIGAAESKEALAQFPGVEFISVGGRRGGSAMAAAAVNALATEKEILR